MMRAMETDIVATSGPSTMAAKVAPTAWPVVPPGSGMLNIMMTKEKAAVSATRGTLRAFIVSRSFRTPIAQNGTVRRNITSDVTGLR
jgi:hypothetical protein